MGKLTLSKNVKTMHKKQNNINKTVEDEKSVYKAKPTINRPTRPTKVKKGNKVLTEDGVELLQRIKNFFTGGTSLKRGKNPKASTAITSPNNLLNGNLAETSNNIQTTPTTSKPKQKKFQYTEPIKFDRERVKVKEVEIIEEKNERVLSVRPKLETVSNLNEVGFFAKIGLVNYFNAKEKGKLEERIEREEYLKNTKSLQKVNSLKSFLLESAKRNLESRETPEITIHVDPSLKEELHQVLDSKLLSSYEIKIIRQDDVLTKLRVEPIEISMKLKKIN